MKTSQDENLIAILCWIVVMSLIAVYVWNEQKPKRMASTSSCIECLRQLAGAKDQWAIENQKSGTDTPTFADLTSIRKLPVCPQGGVYTLHSVAEDPTCSFGNPRGHTL